MCGCDRNRRRPGTWSCGARSWFRPVTRSLSPGARHVPCQPQPRIPQGRFARDRRRRRRRMLGRARGCIEPPRGAVHRVATAGRRDRLLHVPQLRARTRRVRDDRRQLPAAAGSVRRAELFQARPQRALPDQYQQRRRRRRQSYVHVQVPEHACRQPDSRRRQDGVDSADAERLRRRQRPEFARAERPRNLHRRRQPRSRATATTSSPSRMPATARRCSTSRSTTSARRRFRTTSRTRTSTSQRSAFPAATAPAACSSASARIRSSSTSARRST